MCVLLVEDDELLGDGLYAGLAYQGDAVAWVRDGGAALAALAAERFAVVILDIGLPRRSGLDVLRELRRTGDATPILILTARDAVEDRVQGLDAGADDYLVKPFDFNELLARLRALRRRGTGRAEPQIIHGGLVVDPASHSVTMDGTLVEISRREFVLLETLLENCGRVLSRERLEQRLYGWDSEVESNTIEVHIHHLRKKLGADLIRTVRGVGYLIEQRRAFS